MTNRRLTSVNGQPYTWDNNGNLTGDGSKVYSYTQANRLTGVSGSGLVWSAAYNGDGARLKQTVNGVPTTCTLNPSALPSVAGQAPGVPLVTALTEHIIRFDHSVIE